MDECFYGCFAFDGAAFLCDELGQVPGEVVQGGRGRWCWFGGEGVGEVGVAGAELGEFGGELGESGSGGGVVHGAVLERCLVPADGVLFAGDLGGEGVGFGLAALLSGVVVGGGAGDGGLEQGGFLGVEAGERREDGGVGCFGGQAGGGALGGAVAARVKQV